MWSCLAQSQESGPTGYPEWQNKSPSPLTLTHLTKEAPLSQRPWQGSWASVCLLFCWAVAIHRHPSVESGLICHQWPLSSLQPLYSGWWWSTDNTETRDIIISIRQMKEIQFTFDLEKRSSTELLPYKKKDEGQCRLPWHRGIDFITYADFVKGFKFPKTVCWVVNCH